jgi:hypothetical protein
LGTAAWTARPAVFQMLKKERQQNNREDSLSGYHHIKKIF